MSKPSAKKAQRHRKNEQARALRTSLRERRNPDPRFPELVYQENQAAPGFITRVKDILREIAANPRKHLPDDVSEFLFAVRASGIQRVGTAIGGPCYTKSYHPTAGTFHLLKLAHTLGDTVMSRLPRSVWDTYCPHNAVHILPGVPDETTIRVRFGSLPYLKTSGGRAYYSPRRPTVEIEGRKWTVAFVNHAIQRFCERAVADWRTHGGLSDVFTYLHDYVYFEPAILAGNRWAFSLYTNCVPGCISELYVREVLGKIPIEPKHHFRVGYCPVVLQDGFAIAKTLLLPGMDATPEYERYWRHVRYSYGERQRLRERVENLAYSTVAKTGDLRLLREFHEQGTPQVVELNRKVFRID